MFSVALMHRAGSVGLRLVLAPERSAASFDRSHPGRRSSSALAATRGEALQREDGLFDVLPLHSQVGEHLGDVHSCRIQATSAV